MKFEIKNRWSGKVQFEAEIECNADASIGLKVGLAVRWARSNGAVLSGADLSGADLSGADLSGADLRRAVLSGADLSDADLSDDRLAGVPRIPNIHQAVYEAARQPDALDMSTWHCGTTHCRAGWVITLAGEGGKALEWALGHSYAAAVIYLASDPNIERIPDFHASNEAALEDMKRMAEAEAAARSEASL